MIPLSRQEIGHFIPLLRENLTNKLFFFLKFYSRQDLIPAACYSHVRGYVSAHLAQVKNRTWQRVARVRIYTGKLTQG